jgi:hypothetical protein
MVDHGLTRRTALHLTAVGSLLAVQAAVGVAPAIADEKRAAEPVVKPRIELLGGPSVVLRSGDRPVAIPQALGIRIIVGTEPVPRGARLRFSGPMDAFDISDIAILGSEATGVVTDLSVKETAKSGDVVVTVSEALAPGGEYTVVVGTAVGERYPHVAPGRVRAGTVELKTADGVVLASTELTSKAGTTPEEPWAVALAYSADTTNESGAPTGWVTVHSAGSGSVPKGGEIIVLLDRAEGRPGLALGRAGATRPDTSRSADAALTRSSGGAATYKIRIDDAIPAGKSIVIPLNTPDGSAPIRAIEYRAAANARSGRTTGAESVEVPAA